MCVFVCENVSKMYRNVYCSPEYIVLLDHQSYNINRYLYSWIAESAGTGNIALSAAGRKWVVIQIANTISISAHSADNVKCFFLCESVRKRMWDFCINGCVFNNNTNMIRYRDNNVNMMQHSILMHLMHCFSCIIKSIKSIQIIGVELISSLAF